MYRKKVMSTLSLRKSLLLIFLAGIHIVFCFSQDRWANDPDKNRWETQTQNNRWADPPTQQEKPGQIIDREIIDRQIIDREIIDRQIIDREIIDREIIDRTIYYQFGEYVNDIYIVSLRTQDYINSRIAVDPRHEINIGKIMGNIAFGEGAMFVAAVALSMVPGAQPFSAFIVLWHTKALAGAAAGAAISGVVEYISSGGDIESTFTRALEGASDGYKWAAILAVGEDVIKTAKIARATTQGRSAATNFATAYADDLGNIWQYSDDIASKLPKDVVDDFMNYSAAADSSTYAGYQRINAFLDERLPTSALSNAERTEILKRIRNMDSALAMARLPNDMIVHKGMNLSKTALGDLIGIRSIPGGIRDEITNATLSKAIGKDFVFKSYASTSTKLKTAMDFAKGNNTPCLFTISAPKGTHALGMTKALSVNPHEAEILFAHGQKWVCTSARMRDGVAEIAINIIP
jgi:hypothetical protein